MLSHYYFAFSDDLVHDMNIVVFFVLYLAWSLGKDYYLTGQPKCQINGPDE